MHKKNSSSDGFRFRVLKADDSATNDFFNMIEENKEEESEEENAQPVNRLAQAQHNVQKKMSLAYKKHRK